MKRGALAAGSRRAKRKGVATTPRASPMISAKTRARASPAPSPASGDNQEIASAAMAVRRARAIAAANMPTLAVKCDDLATAPLHMLATQAAWRARRIGS